MLANAGQQVRGDRAEGSDDQGRVQEHAQQRRHEQVYSAEPSTQVSTYGTTIVR
jgi:hypothetical protein